MGYVEDTLTSGELVVGRTTLHWTVFVKPVVATSVGAVVAGISIAYGSIDAVEELLNAGWDALDHKQRRGVVLAGFGLALALPGVIGWLVAYVRYKTSEFAVTNRRVLLKTGFIARKTDELILRKVESINVNQGIIGRILGYGSILVVGSGGSTDRYKRIANPMDFRREIQQQIALSEDSQHG